MLNGCFSATSFFDSNSPAGQDEGRLYHLVLCWLKEPGNESQIERIAKVCENFAKIPEVREVAAGRVVSSERTIVDDGFDVGILVVLSDEEALQAYLDHPIHRKAKDEVLLPLVEKVVVYDFKK